MMREPWSLRISLLLISAIGTLPVAGDPTQPALLPVEISLSEWGLEDPAAIRLGRVGVMYGDEIDQLVAYILRNEEPKSRNLKSTSEKPPLDDGCAIVAELTGGNTNRLGGTFNTFQREPSIASFAVDRRADGQRTLGLTYARMSEGFAGLWMHLYDSAQQGESRTLLDASQLDTLSFWIRGREGGERLNLKLADERLDKLGDSLAVDDLASFLPAGKVTRDWQQAIVPLKAAPQGKIPPAIDLSRLATFVLEAAEGAGTVELLRVAFCAADAEMPPRPKLAPKGEADTERDLIQAVWIWNTRQILDSTEEQVRLGQFLARGEFTDVYLQLPNVTGEPARLAPDAANPESPLRSLVADLRGLGIAVRALDGHASFVLGDKPKQVLQTIRDVAAYNEAVPYEERFTGVHYDVEPYLLPGWGGPRRQEILDRYAKLVARMTIETRRAGLEIGVDLPFWYDAPDEFDGSLMTVKFARRQKLITEQVLDFVDYATLMDYRTSAYGPDGVLSHAEGELAYATRVGKQLVIGLETGELPDEAYLDFRGKPDRGWPSANGEYVAMVIDGDRATLHLVSDGEPERPDAIDGEVLHWPITSRVGIPAAKLTFYEHGLGALDAVQRQVRHELDSTVGFAGFALHHYLSLQELATTP